jgi:tetratricopeptide (TPR) repeat protein
VFFAEALRNRNFVEFTMDMYKQIMVLIIFGMLNIFVLSDVICGEKSPGNTDFNEDGYEIEEMLETLKRERMALKELKSELQGTSQIIEDTSKNMTDEVIKIQKEKVVKKVSKSVSTNVKKRIEKKEEPLKEEDNAPLSIEKNVVKGTITPEQEDKEIEKIKKAVKNGEEIVHPFELAESLYKLGGYRSALDLYNLINRDSLDKGKKAWVTYQIANCYRKRKLFNEAVEVYRKMLNEFEGTYWANQAEWYIQDIQWRTKAEGILEKVIIKG